MARDEEEGGRHEVQDPQGPHNTPEKLERLAGSDIQANAGSDIQANAKGTSGATIMSRSTEEKKNHHILSQCEQKILGHDLFQDVHNGDPTDYSGTPAYDEAYAAQLLARSSAA